MKKLRSTEIDATLWDAGTSTCLVMILWQYKVVIIMVALCNRADHYIFILFLSFFFFSSPNLSGRRLDVYHTSTHGVALVRI